MIEQALEYARSGFRVFPLHTPHEGGLCSCHRACGRDVGKHPRTMDGLKSATTDEAQIKKWWGMWERANIGLRTGAESGLIVLDVDPRHGGHETLKQLLAKHAPLTEKVYVKTGGGGWHLYFAHPGFPVKSRANALGPGLDVKGEGGYVVAPPSLHVSGAQYEWGAEFVSLPEMPDWLRELLRAEAPRVYDVQSDGEMIAEGGRNQALTSLAGSMRRRGMSEEAIYAALQVENEGRCQPPLSDADVRKIAHSIARYAPEDPTYTYPAKTTMEGERPEGIYRISDLFDEIDELYEKGRQRGASTGWAALDYHYTVKRGQWTIISGIPAHGKALSLDTPLPTPTGWTTMGAVKVGDELLDEQGQVCRVVAATDVMYGRECYEVEFSDGTKVICDAEHEWLTRTDKARRSEYQAKKKGRFMSRPLKPKGTDQSHLRTFPGLVTARELANSIYAEKGRRFNHAVQVAAPIDLPQAELPIDPYVLGAWLGDGVSTGGAMSVGDVPILERFEAAGYRLTKHQSKYTYGVLGLASQLRAVKVMGDKHIPLIYLRASRLQRLSLLQGLMDTDGYITSYGRCEFTNMNRRLAEQVYELVASLGWIPKIITGRAMLYGKDCGEKYRVTFTPNACVFHLRRKGQYTRERTPRLGYRRIVGCRPVESVPVKCVEVDSPSHLYLCSKAFIPTHNSSVLSALLVNLANLYDWRFAICSPENQPLADYASELCSIWAGEPFEITVGGRRMTRETKEAAKKWLDEHFVFVLPPEGECTVTGILERAAYLYDETPLHGLVIDPWNELEHRRPANMNETEYVSQSLSRMRRFARDNELHLWLVAHPTKLQKDMKTGTYPVPTLYDISGSAHFYNKADFGLSVWRDVKEENSPTQVHVQKARFRWCGKPGMVELYFNLDNGRFAETRPSYFPEYTEVEDPTW